MRIGVLRERLGGERRVALTADAAAQLVTSGHEVVVETGAGGGCAISDGHYVDAGATVGEVALVASCDLVVAVRGPGTFEGSAVPADIFNDSSTAIAMFDPLWHTCNVEAVASTGATMLSLELVPRITRAQSMDVLSSMASVAGYEAVLLAASRFGRMFPLMMTAAGTLPAARVLVLGAGVAGLNAIATARRLGAIVSAYDVRPAAAEQIESLGARSIDLTAATEASTSPAETAGGYAAAQTDEQNQRQRRALTRDVADSDVLITTAAIPGRASPLLVTTDMVAEMRPGSVIVDLAAERGGNCEPTQADAEVTSHGVTVLGPTDLATRSPLDASSMFATNVVNLITHLAAEDTLALEIDHCDEITSAMLVTSGGEVVHEQVRAAIEQQGKPT